MRAVVAGPLLAVLLSSGCTSRLAYAPGKLPECVFQPSSADATAASQRGRFCRLGRQSATSGWFVTGPDGEEHWVSLVEYPISGDWQQIRTLATCRMTASTESDFRYRDDRLRYTIAIVRPRWDAPLATTAAQRAAWAYFAERQTRTELGWAVTLVDAYTEISARLSEPGTTVTLEQAQAGTIPSFEAYQRCICSGRCVDACTRLPALLERTRWIEDRRLEPEAGAQPEAGAP